MGKCTRTEHKSNINTNIAKTLVLHRIWNGYTQSKIAECIHVTFQQIQKYEKCINRIPADHLIDICKQKRWDISLFINDHPEIVFGEWINNVDQMTEDSPYPLRIDQINRAWEKIDNVGKHNYLTRQTNPRYKTLIQQLEGN